MAEYNVKSWLPFFQALMNYKTVAKPGEWEPIPNTDGKYVTSMYDIVEAKTDHVVATLPGFNDQAKAMTRHLNMGGGFAGWTPAFFLEQITPIKFGDLE